MEFAYNGHPVLSHFDLEIEKGKTYALVGASGCGKSTVVDLLCRFYQPQKGEIAIDDAPCRAFGLGKYRDRIGLVSQEAPLFRDSVLENIRYGRLDSSKGEVERAAAELEINGADVHAPEDSLATVCDSKANLSGGQKQRIALARAVLKNPEIIVLDEATSALDSESEEKLLRRLKGQADDKTVIIVSHRLSAVREVDEIVCMDEGKIVEKGTHAELIQKKGHYWALFKLGTKPDACILVVNSTDSDAYIQDTLDGIRILGKAPVILLAMSDKEKHARSVYGKTWVAARPMSEDEIQGHLERLEASFGLPAVAIVAAEGQQRMVDIVVNHFAAESRPVAEDLKKAG